MICSSASAVVALTIVPFSSTKTVDAAADAAAEAEAEASSSPSSASRSAHGSSSTAAPPQSSTTLGFFTSAAFAVNASGS